MCWIQISNHVCFWLRERSSNIKQYVVLLCKPSFCQCSKVGWKFVSSVCKHINYWNRVFSNCFDVLNPNIKSFLLLVEWKTIKHKKYVLVLCEPSFCHCCKVGYKFVSSVCEHRSCWNRVLSNCFDVLNPNIKLCLLLVEWKIIKHKIISVFVMWTISLSLL